MSARMTSIHLPGIFGSGVADWGKNTIPEMVALLRSKAEQDKAVAEAIISASDDQFHVETYIGVHAKRHRMVLQKSTLKTASGKKGD